MEFGKGQLFLDFTQSNLNFGPSYVGIHQLCRDEFSHLEFWTTSNFRTYHDSRQHTFHKITKLHSHFQPKLKWEGKKLLTFRKQLIQKS